MIIEPRSLREDEVEVLKKIKEYYYPESECSYPHEGGDGYHFYHYVKDVTYEKLYDGYLISVKISEGQITTDMYGTDLGGWDDYNENYTEILKVSKDFKTVERITKKEMPFFYAEYRNAANDEIAVSDGYDTVEETERIAKETMKNKGYTDYILQEYSTEVEQVEILTNNAIEELNLDTNEEPER